MKNAKKMGFMREDEEELKYQVSLKRAESDKRKKE